jgi:uncharacterized membrane protein
LALALQYPVGKSASKGSKTMGGKMKKQSSMGLAVLSLTAVIAAGCAGGPMSSREKGAGIGAVGGAAAGGLIGTAFGRPGLGAAIGAGTGLVGGAMVGDYMQGQEQEQNYNNQQQIQQNQRAIDRNNQVIQRQRSGEY